MTEEVFGRRNREIDQRITNWRDAKHNAPRHQATQI